MVLAGRARRRGEIPFKSATRQLESVPLSRADMRFHSACQYFCDIDYDPFLFVSTRTSAICDAAHSG